MSEYEDPNWETLVEFVGKQQAASRVPGIAAGIFYNGKVQAQGFGVTNVNHPLAVTDDTLFQIGSITKTFTGTLIMRLVEEGKLELDTLVRSYLPDFRVADADVSARVTLRHLMTHIGGWEGDLFLDTGPGDDALADYVAAMAEQAQLAPLAEHWSYNNSGFALLGHLIERVTGKHYEQVLKDELLEPLEMTETFLNPTDVMTLRYAVGHSVSASGITVLRPWHLQRALAPMGGLITDVHNLLRYARFHLSDASIASQPILSAASVRAMQEQEVTVWGDEGWGLTWGLEHIDGVQIVSHGGGTNGQITRLLLVPARNFALAVFTNAQQGGASSRAIVDKALELYLGIKRVEPTVSESPKEGLDEYAGFYANSFSEVELGVLGGRLIGQFVNKKGFPTQDTPPAPPPPPVTFGLVAENRLMALDGGFKDQLVDVVRTPDGAIAYLRIGGRLYRRSR
jgi:CubicO group peptidase (beta-lactamase class C family)